MSAGRKIHSLSQDWGTPRKYVDAVKEVFGGAVDLDPCSNKFSIVGARVEYHLPGHDGLKESWDFPRIYVNPPYGIDHERGTSIKQWLYRCALANRIHESEVLALVPVATNTGHWKRYVFTKARAVCFLYDTRLRFLVNGKDGGKGAPMSCAMIYWGDHYEKFRDVFGKHGAVVNLTEMLTLHLHAGSNDAQPELISEFHRSENGSELVLAKSAVEYGISKRPANHRGTQPGKRPLAKH
jgi:hypothetical protein